MDSLTKPINTAQRRLTVQSFLDKFGHLLLWALGLSAIAAVASRFIVVPFAFEQWVIAWLATGVGVAFIAAIVWTIFTRPSRVEAAVMVDKRLQLRERLSSVEQLSVEDRSTAMGQALIADAQRRAEGIDVRDHFPVRLQAHWLYCLVPSVLLGGAFLLSPPEPIDPKMADNKPITVEQVKNSTEALLKDIKKQREAAEKEDLPETEFFKNLESDLQKLRSNPPKEETKLLSELKKMEDQLTQKRNELGSGEALKKQLAKLDKIEDGPAAEMAESLKNGDMEEANEKVSEMLERLEKGQLTDAEKKQLEKQLDTIKKALEDAAKEHEQAKKQLEEQIKQAEKSGDSDKAAQLQKKLEEMSKSDAEMASMKELAEQLSECSECMKKGDGKGASKALKEMSDKLSTMAKNQKQAQQLKELAENLNNSKRSSSCSQCNGDGCAQCQGGNKSGDGAKDFANREGKGAGKRDEEKNDTNDYDSQVRGNVQQGETAFGGRIGGENKKSETQQQVREAIIAAEIEEPDPIEQANLPKRESDVSREYMDSLREGK